MVGAQVLGWGCIWACHQWAQLAACCPPARQLRCTLVRGNQLSHQRCWLQTPLPQKLEEEKRDHEVAVAGGQLASWLATTKRGGQHIACLRCGCAGIGQPHAHALSPHHSLPLPPPTAAGPAIPPGQEPDLGMRVLLVDGDETIADSAQGGLAKASDEFKAWIAKKWPAKEAVAV